MNRGNKVHPYQAGRPAGGRNSASSKASPGAVSRFLWSCGYEVEGQSKRVPGDWFRCEVKDRRTGEAKGVRWVRPARGERPGYEVRSTDPNPKIRDPDAARKCPTCEGPLVTLAAGQEVPFDVCSQQVGDDLPGVLCVTMAKSIGGIT